MKYLATATLTSFIIVSSPLVALADECDTMAAKIAKSVDWIVQPRTPARFIPMSNGEYGASLNCGGTYGLNLHATRLMPDVPLQDITRAASILTEVAPANIRDGIQRCIKLAEASGGHYAEVLTPAHIFCDLTVYGDHEYLDLIIAER
jgi:hypothetical protein